MLAEDTDSGYKRRAGDIMNTEGLTSYSTKGIQENGMTEYLEPIEMGL
jgi:hypothetical protein